MRLSAIASVVVAVAGLAAATPAFASDTTATDAGVCSFVHGTTTCAVTTTTQRVVPAPAHAYNCQATQTVTDATTRYTAHHGQINSSGIAVPAPSPTVTETLSKPLETCRPLTPALTYTYQQDSSGREFLQIAARDLQPNAPLTVTFTAHQADGTVTPLPLYTSQWASSSQGTFGTGVQIRCEENVQSYTVDVSDGLNSLETTAEPVTDGVCPAPIPALPSLSHQYVNDPAYPGTPFFQIDARNLLPNTPLSVTISLTYSDGTSQVLSRDTIHDVSSPNGGFGTGVQIHCDMHVTTIATMVSDGVTTLTDSSNPVAEAACPAQA